MNEANANAPCVLMATDLTEASHAAAHFAAKLCVAKGAVLELVHVVDRTGLDPLPESTDPAVAVYLEKLRERLHERFDAQAIALDVERARCETLGARCETALYEGRVWEALLRRAAPPMAPVSAASAGPRDAPPRPNVEFIVVGPHTKTRGEKLLGTLGERLLGSTADRVVRHAPCPVWVVPQTERASSEEPLKQLMVAVDFSPVSNQAVQLAAGLARQAGGELHLVHVLPHGYHGDSSAEFKGDLEHAPPTVLANDAKSRVHHLASSLDGLRVHEHVRVAKHNVPDELAAAAEESQASALVLGSHSRSVLDHLVLGSTAERCLRQAALPILVVRG